MSKKKEVRQVVLTLHSLRIQPLKDFERVHTTKSILKEIFKYVREERNNGNGLLIDRHGNYDKPEPREIYMTSYRPIPKENRIRCSMALLRKGKQPKLKPKGKFKLMPINKVDGDIAEETHFFIDFTTEKCIICAEYNHVGPRVSDLEFYLRHLAGTRNLKLARATTLSNFYSYDLDETLAGLRNVLHMDVKFRPSDLAKMDSDVRSSYFSSMASIGSRFKPQFFRIETYFQTPGSNAPVAINQEANSWFREILGIFKSRTRNTKFFQNFEVKFENMNGDEEIFNLLKGKEEIHIEVDPKKDYKNKEMYTLVKPSLDQFIAGL